MTEADAAPVTTSPFLRSFYELVSPDASEKAAGVTGLLDHLRARSEEGEDGQRSVACVEDIAYTVKRLVRGLCSSRASARQGFAAALVRVLCTFPEDTPLADVLKQVISATKPSGSQRGHEDRDQFFGRVFGCMALQRSGRLAENTSDAMDATFLVVRELLQLMTAKRWLGDLCCECVLAVVRSSPVKTLERVLPAVLGTIPSDASSCTLDHLHLAIGLVRSCHTHMASWQKKAKKSKTGSVAAIVQRLQQFGQLLTPEGLQRVLPSLMAATRTFPLVHSVWLHIMGALLGVDLAIVASNDDADAASRIVNPGAGVQGASFAKFWKVAVEEGLMNSTHERRATALVLLQTVAVSPAMSPALVRVLLSRRVFGVLRNNMGVRDNYLQQPARATVAVLHKVAEHDKEIAAELLSVFLGMGGPHFDARTHTRTVATFQDALDDAALVSHSELLQRTFCDPLNATVLLGGDAEDAPADDAETARVVASKRVWALDGIAACCRSAVGSASSDVSSSLVDSTLAFLTRFAFFESSGEPHTTDVEVDDATRTEAHARLFTVLDNLATASATTDAGAGAGAGGGAGSKAGPADHLTSVQLVHDKYNELAAGGLEAVTQLGEAAAATRTQALAAMATLTKAAAALSSKPEGEGAARQLRDFAALLGLAALLQLSDSSDGAGEDSEDEDMAEDSDSVTGLLGDLVQCGLELCRTGLVAAAVAAPSGKKSHKRPVRRSRRNSNVHPPTSLDEEWDPTAYALLGEEEVAPDAMEKAVSVFVDVCLALLSRPSKLVRNLVRSTFRQYAVMLTPEAISTMLGAVFNKRSGDDGSDSDSDDDMMVHANGGDVSADHAKEVTLLQEAMNSGALKNADGSDDEGVGDLASLLGGGAVTKDAKPTKRRVTRSSKKVDESDSDSDDGSDSGSVVSAGAADMMDAMLVNMIKLRQEKKGRVKAMREQALHFRYRVLDLVEAAVTRLAGHPLLLEFPLPMLRAVRGLILRIQQDRGAREAAGLLGRVQAILASRVCKAKVPHATEDGASGVLPDHVHTLLEETLALALRGGGTQFVALASSVSWMLLRALRAGGSMAERTGLLDEDRVGAMYVNMASHYMNSKNPKVNFKVFIDLSRRAPYLAWRLAPIMCTAAQGDSTASSFRRREAFDFLVSLARHMPAGGATATSLLPDLFTCVTRTLNEVSAQLKAGSTPSLNGKRLKSAFLLGTTLLASHGGASGAAELVAACTSLLDVSKVSSITAGCKRCIAASRPKPAKGKKKKSKAKAKSAKRQRATDDEVGAGGGAANGGASGAATAASGKAKKKSKSKKKQKAKEGSVVVATTTADQGPTKKRKKPGKKKKKSEE